MTYADLDAFALAAHSTTTPAELTTLHRHLWVGYSHRHAFAEHSSDHYQAQVLIYHAARRLGVRYDFTYRKYIKPFTPKHPKWS